MDELTRRALATYVVVVLVCVAAFAAAAYAIGDKAGQMGGLVLLPLAVVPMLAAWIGHRQLRSAERLFSGLVWGGSWIFGAWLLGAIAGLAALVLAVGLGAMVFDPSMSMMLGVAAAEAAKSGQDVPESAMGFIRVTMQISAFAAPTIGVVFTAALGCLGTFPWLGWFGRRMLSAGRLPAVLSLALLWGVIGVSGAFAPVPGGLDLGMSLGARMLAGAVSAACLAPVLWWLFLRTRSAVVPAVFQAALQGVATLGMYYGADVNFLLGPPSGLLVAGVSLCTGLALWVWKDPGGGDMALPAAQA